MTVARSCTMPKSYAGEPLLDTLAMRPAPDPAYGFCEVNPIDARFAPDPVSNTGSQLAPLTGTAEPLERRNRFPSGYDSNPGLATRFGPSAARAAADVARTSASRPRAELISIMESPCSSFQRPGARAT